MSYFFIVLCALIVLFAIIYFLQDRFIFFPEQLPSDYSFDLSSQDKEVFFTTADQETINGILFTTTQRKGVVLYFHGNAGSLASWQDIGKDITPLGYDLLIIDFRGYGKSTGQFSEEGLYNDGVASYEYLLANQYKSDEIIIFGRSLGTGMAVDLASKVKAKALILETPFTTLPQLANTLYPFLFPSTFIKYTFDNFSKVKGLSLPIFVLHGDRDKVIPLKHGRKLFLAASGYKKMCIIKGGSHNDLNEFPEYHTEMIEFLDSLPE